MRARPVIVGAIILVGSLGLTGQAPRHFNPVIDLLAQKKPVFGVYAPSNPRWTRRCAAAGRRASAEDARATRAGSARELQAGDFVFDGTMEGGEISTRPAAFRRFRQGDGRRRLDREVARAARTHPLIVKTPRSRPRTRSLPSNASAAS